MCEIKLCHSLSNKTRNVIQWRVDQRCSMLAPVIPHDGKKKTPETWTVADLVTVAHSDVALFCSRRPSLVACRPSLVGWRPSLLGWRPSRLEWHLSLASRDMLWICYGIKHGWHVFWHLFWHTFLPASSLTCAFRFVLAYISTIVLFRSY